jgi:3-hydroxyisobutyrate dehydrogenase-like beta-hydroxyacid dehydrogenase
MYSMRTTRMMLFNRCSVRAFHAAPILAARVGFIGLGHMGKPMALNLLKAGNQLTVFDVAAAPVQELERKGAKKALSPADVASNVDVIVTMLPSSPHVREVYDSAGGVFASCKPGTLLVDCSTIDPTVTRALAVTALNKKASACLYARNTRGSCW